MSRYSFPSSKSKGWIEAKSIHTVHVYIGDCRSCGMMMVKSDKKRCPRCSRLHRVPPLKKAVKVGLNS